MDLCHELFCVFEDFYASGTYDAEVTKSQRVMIKGCGNFTSKCVCSVTLCSVPLPITTVLVCIYLTTALLMRRGKADLLPFVLIPHKVVAVLTWEIECREGVRENWNSKDITIRK